ncbi:MAG: iron-containing alcohol dehydrogenase [Bacteroidetes bacterium]|nr:iron-containing alcohol dehydrogenase [Bacteroidota bacterium]
MPKHFTFSLPPSIYFGREAWRALDVQEKIAICIVSKSTYKNDYLISTLVNIFKASNSTISFIEKSSGEPSSEIIDSIVKLIPSDCNMILGVGGGSVLDTAKYIAMLLVSGGVCLDYEYGEREIIGSIPTYLIPTTAGSGSEMTPYSVIQNSASGRKFTISDPCMFPNASYIDPELTHQVPLNSSIASGLDAFIHSMEASLNQIGNPIISPLSQKGLELSFINLPLLSAGFANDELRSNLSFASLLGGYSISHVRTGLIHTISVAIAEYTQESHGLLNARVLPYAIRYNIQHFNGLLAQIINQSTQQNFVSDIEAATYLIEWIEDILKAVQLKEITNNSIGENIDHLCDRVLQDKTLPHVNPAPIDRDTLARMFREMSINGI